MKAHQTRPPAPDYHVRFQDVAVAGGSDLRIRALRDTQQYHDPDGEAAAAGIPEACWSLFGQVWPSAQKLADLMQDYALNGRRVLEIGCGLALASLVIHRRRGDVTASDCHPLTQSFIRANLLLNRLPAMKYQTGNWGRDNPALGQFDLIIGSDVLYQRDQPVSLSDFIAEHAAPTAEVLIVDPNRGNRSAFNKQMAAQGFERSETAITAPLFDGSAYRGRLLRYLRG
ncbi:SAM-dependent methyltransferase [Xenophilus sp. AP218F]|nr:SAM-dependent methyltransferase [Xenophilus sp. AP218F]